MDDQTTNPPPAEEAPVVGARERKRDETRRRLTRAAQQLFVEKGFEGTTVDEIASAAGVSRRTFFHHFGSKEDVVLSRHDDFVRALLDAIRTAPRDEALLAVAERAMIAALKLFDPEEAQLIAQLKRVTPALHARDQAKYEQLERAIAGALAERSGTDAADIRTRLEAMMVTGLLRVGGEAWVSGAAAGVPNDEFVRQVVRSFGARLLPIDP